MKANKKIKYNKRSNGELIELYDCCFYCRLRDCLYDYADRCPFVKKELADKRREC